MAGNKSKRFQGLQILRILAACLVLVTHVGFYASERLDRGFHYWTNGARGVDLFFVISGFVIIYSSKKLLGDANGWKHFAWHRIIRIVPMYWIATTIKLVALFLAAGYILHARFDLFKVLESYLFLPSRNVDGEFRPLLGVGWTLNFEMFFYFLFTIALFLRRNVFPFLGVILVMLSAGAAFTRPDWPPISFYLHGNVLEFLFGMLIARMSLAQVKLPSFVSATLVAVGLCTLLAPVSLPSWSPAAGLILEMSAGAVVLGVVQLEKFLVNTPAFILLGADASYVIYLFHPIVAPSVPTALARLHIHAVWLSIPLSIAVALCVGCLIHLVVEKPLTRWLYNRTPDWAELASAKASRAAERAERPLPAEPVQVSGLNA